MASLPNADRAILDLRKIADYCLSPVHPRGRHKARVFRSALGIKQKDSAWLRLQLLTGVRDSEGVMTGRDARMANDGGWISMLATLVAYGQSGRFGL